MYHTWVPSTRADILAKYLYTHDTLTVYGIAAAIFSPRYLDSLGAFEGELRRDEAYDSCIEALRLYRADPAGRGLDHPHHQHPHVLEPAGAKVVKAVKGTTPCPSGRTTSCSGWSPSAPTRPPAAPG